MGLSLNETHILSKIASLLYSFLPGSAPFQGTYTFADAAKEIGVGNYWQGGSKEPAIQKLLELTYSRRDSAFPRLITIIVRESIKYRQKKNPLTRQELISLNSLLLQIRIEIPQLHDTTFLERFPSEGSDTVVKLSVDPVRLSKLLTAYKNLLTNPDHQSRGYELQDLICGLLELYDLKPRSPFRLTGEEIDGSFELDHETYLLEARWRKNESVHSDLVSFSAKVQAKADWSRGLFLSTAGFHLDALDSITHGRRPNFIIMTGPELEMCLKGEKNLIDLLRMKVRKLAETGQLS